jgi:TolB-like protein
MEPGKTCPPFSDALINEQLQRIFTNPGFSVSDILKRFLQYIVQETLAGRSNMIKEYTIGVNVLNKPADFKPQHDAIVRIHAGRLRRALNKYYKESGSEDVIEISIPKGSYVPAFDIKENGFSRPESKTQERHESLFPNTTRIAVMPFRCYDNDHGRLSFADSIGQQLSEEFGRFADFSVVAYYATRQVSRRITDIRELCSLYGARYAVTGNLQFEGKRLRVGVQLTDLADGEQLWAERYDYTYDVLTSFDIQDELVSSVVGALADYYGLIVQHAAKNFLRENREQISASKALIWYNCFHAQLNDSTFNKALLAMDLAVKENPDYEIAWACLGEFYLHGHLFHHNFTEDPILLGLQCAHRALKINPRSAPAYITLAWANLYLKNKPATLEAVSQALSLQPNGSSIMGSAGSILICAGEYEKGMKWLSKAIQLNKSYAPALNFSIALYHLKKKDFSEALLWVDKVNLNSFTWHNILRVLTNAGQRSVKTNRTIGLVSHDEFRELVSVNKEFIGKCLLDQELVDRLYKGLKSAKIPVLTVA